MALLKILCSLYCIMGKSTNRYQWVAYALFFPELFLKFAVYQTILILPSNSHCVGK